MKHNHKKALLIETVAGLTGALAIGAAIFTIKPTVKVAGSETTYSLTLDKDTLLSDGKLSETSLDGNDFLFSTTGTDLESGLVSLASNGTIANDTVIHGIKSISAVFDGALSLSAYDGSNGEADAEKSAAIVEGEALTSGAAYEFSFLPDFFSLTADEETSVTSLTIVYTCVDEMNEPIVSISGDGVSAEFANGTPSVGDSVTLLIHTGDKAKYLMSLTINGTAVEASKIAFEDGTYKVSIDIVKSVMTIKGAVSATPKVYYLVDNSEIFTIKGDAFKVQMEEKASVGLKYASGDGSKENPLVINSFDLLKSTLTGAGHGYRLSYKVSIDADGDNAADAINLGDVVTTPNQQGYYNIDTFAGNLDFDGAKVIVPKSSTTYWGFFQNYAGEFKNATIVPADYSASTTLFYTLLSNSVVSNVTLGEEGVETVMNVENNESLLCINTYNVTFNNLKSYVNYDNGLGYNAAFIGGYAFQNYQVYFNNCVNYGDLTSLNAAAVFVGNMSQFSDNYHFENCSNYGTVTAPGASLYIAQSNASKDTAIANDAKFSGASNNGKLVYVDVIADSAIGLFVNAGGKYELAYQNTPANVDHVVVTLSTYLTFSSEENSYGTFLVKFPYAVDLKAEDKAIGIKSGATFSSEVKLDENLGNSESELRYDAGSNTYTIYVGNGIYNFANASYLGVKDVYPSYGGNGSFAVRYTSYTADNEVVGVSKNLSLKF